MSGVLQDKRKLILKDLIGTGRPVLCSGQTI